MIRAEAQTLAEEAEPLPEAPPPPAPSLKQHAVSGVAMVMAQNVIGRLTLVLGQLVLARILTPADFGAVALASTMTGVAAGLLYFGVDQILQQRRQNARYWATQVQVLSLAFASIGALLMVALGFVGREIFHDRNLPALMAISALASLISAFWPVPQAALQWQLRFKLLTSYTVFDTVLGQLLMILCACVGMGPFSFFAPQVLTNLLRAAVYWRAAGVRLRPLPRSRGWRPMIRRGLSLLGSRVAMVITSQGDFLILGLFASHSVVGAYFFAFRLASQPMTLLASSISNVLFSSLLKIPDRARRATIAFETSEVIGAATVLLCLTFAVAAPAGIALLFGERWRAAAPLIQLLSLGMPFDTIGWPAAAMMLANGEFRRNLIYQSWSAPLFLLLVTLGAAKASASGVAAGVAAFYVVHALAYSAAAYHRTPVRARGAAALFAKLMLCAGVSFGPTYALVSLPVLHEQLIAQLAIAVIVGPALYVAAIFLIARPVFQKAVGQFDAALARFAPGLYVRWSSLAQRSP